MLKKKMLIALGVAAVLSVSCVSVTVWAEENAEEQCGKRSQYRRHAAESAQADKDPRDAGDEETEAECATDQGPAAHSPVAAGFLTQKDE